MGIINPVTFWSKVFLQKLWTTTNLNWDESLPHSLCEEWKELTRMWQSLSSLQVPRFIGQIDTDSVYQLLVFCDASTKSYAATVYSRIVSSTSIRVNLVYSKMGPAPLDSRNQCKHGRKQVTLPRLELLAVVTGVQVINFVTSEHKLLITERMLFTDFEFVLQ